MFMARKKRGQYKKFVLLENKTIWSEKWFELTSIERDIYIFLKSKFNGSNNGKLALTYSELPFSDATISKALKGLIKKEWIEKTKYGGMYRYYCLYKLTGKYDAIK